MMRQPLHPSHTPSVDSEHDGRSIVPDLTSTGPIATYFQQSCPVCSRRLLILVEYLGDEVRCDHCRAAFVARDVSQDRRDTEEVGSSILERAEQLLALLESSDRNRRMCKV
jgi:hypothetical protein